MLNWLKLSHHSNTGRFSPHDHTSYLPLAILLLVVGFALTIYSVSAASPPPQEGSVGLTGTVPGPAPTTAATITKPNDQQHTSTSPINVSGSCPKDTIVEVFKNEIFTGSTACTDSGTFAIDVDLLFGKNEIVARVYDALNQAGPDSNLITIYYDILAGQPGPLSSFNFGGSQLLLNTDAVYRGVFPDKEMQMPIDILGGTPPYAVNVQWGDTNNKVIPRPDNTSFTTAHTYSKPGVYQVSLQASDTKGRVAFLGVAVVVNGQPSTGTGSSSTPGSPPNQLLLLWPVYTAIIGILISFWLGERREKRIINKPVAVLPT
jgi:hypothetical protein